MSLHGAGDLGETPHLEVETWKNILTRSFGYQESDIICMMDIEPNKRTEFWPSQQNILQQLSTLVEGVQAKDRRFLFIAGHGGQLPSTSDSTELDNRDEVLWAMEEDGSCRIIKDNTIRITLNIDRFPAGASLRAICELCHSGTLLDLPFRLELENGATRITDAKRKPQDVEGDIVCISACEDDQKAYHHKDSKGNTEGLITATFRCTSEHSQPCPMKVSIVDLLKSLLSPVEAEGSSVAQELSQTPMVTLGKRLNTHDLKQLFF